MNGEREETRRQHEHARLAFRLTAVATISRDAKVRNTNAEEEKAGISSHTFCARRRAFGVPRECSSHRERRLEKEVSPGVTT